MSDVRISGDLNRLSDRAAMGLPERYVAPAAEPLGASVQRLRGEDPASLAAVLQTREADLETRLAAGLLLGVLGDPRLDALDPPLVTIPRGRARLGLDPGRVDELHRRYERYGVRRSWIEKECPRFEVEIGAFRLARYPVTNLEYAVFLEATGAPELPTAWPFGRIPIACANHPVYTVTPAMADAYVRWLAARTGRPFRLPTEYEWEYAATGGDGRDFPWGDEFRPECANTMDLGLLSTTPVGAFPAGASPFGALDMAGNVEEYVATAYHAYPGGHLVEDDLYRLLGHYRIARGGAFNRFADLARCQRRHGPYPKSLYAIGFRVAEDLGDSNGRRGACTT